MKILLTGGAGFIATHTCVELMAAGHDVVVVDNYVNSQPEALRRDGDVDACYADPTKAKELLGWTATKTLEDMCRDSWRWQKANPNGYQDK